MGDENRQVSQPHYYTRGGLECITAINAWGLSYCLGSALKYICRAGHKDPMTTDDDLAKAIRFLEMERERLASSGTGRPSPRGDR